MKKGGQRAEDEQKSGRQEARGKRPKNISQAWATEIAVSGE